MNFIRRIEAVQRHQTIEVNFFNIHQCWIEAQHCLHEQEQLLQRDHEYDASLHHQRVLCQQLLI